MHEVVSSLECGMCGLYSSNYVAGYRRHPEMIVAEDTQDHDYNIRSIVTGLTLDITLLRQCALR